MVLENVEAIAKFLRRNRDVAKWMAAWTEIALEAEWNNIQDVRRDFPSADGVKIRDGTVITVFNVKGNTYRMLTRISYQRQAVSILNILTHADYSRGDWKG
jgi:mRNA interferase HigB